MSRRTDQVASLIVSIVSKVLSRDFEAPVGSLVTVMRAEVAPDLKTAIVYVSVLPEHATGAAMKALERFSRQAQHAINKTLSMKFVPKISWELDLTTRKYAAVDEALSS